MDEDIQNNKTVVKAVRKLQRRRERNKQGTNLLDILKQSREAAGLPLNATNMEQAGQPETVHERPEKNISPIASIKSDAEKVPQKVPRKPSPKQSPKPETVIVKPDWDDRNGCEVTFYFLNILTHVLHNSKVVLLLVK